MAPSESTETAVLLSGNDKHAKTALFAAHEIESDEPQMESVQHLRQLVLLITCLEWLWKNRTDFFVGGNLSVYYDRENPTRRKFCGPDLFVVLNTNPRPRRSWMVWEEGGKFPNVIVELLSDNTAKADRGKKKELYQDTFRTPEYFWFHPHTFEFQGFKLVAQEYEAIAPNQQGWLWSQELQLFLGVLNDQLRFFTPDENLVITPSEAAIQRQNQLEAEKQRVHDIEAQNQRLSQRLREMGINPDEV